MLLGVRAVQNRGGYQVSKAITVEWLRLATRRNVVARGLRVGAVVGTVLVAINQGDALISGEMPLSGFWKISLTYVVPYLVSTYSSVSAIRAGNGGAEDG